MQENSKRNKEIITIKVLASAAVLNILAAGFTLMYSKNQNKEIETEPTKIATLVNPVYNEIKDNSEYMSTINKYNPNLKPPVNHPYIPGSTDETAPKPTLGPPYKPGLTEDDLYTNSRTLPIPDEIAENYPIYNEINNGTIPAPTEITDQSNVVLDKTDEIVKGSKPIQPPLGENDLIRTARNRYILNNIKDSLDEKNNSQAEAIVDQSNVSFEKEASIVKGKANLPKNMNIGEPYGPWDKTNPINEAIHQHTMDIINNNDDIKENAIVKGKANLPKDMNIGEPYGPWDKTNPVNEAVHQHTMDIINNNDDIKENAIVKGKVNLPPYTNIGEPYGPWDKTNPVNEAIHQHTMDIAAHNYIDEYFPYIDKIHENELHAMMPNTNQPVVPPYKPNEESDEHTRSI